MAHHAPRQPALPDLVDLAAQMDQDHNRERAWLWRRDRELGQELASLKGRPAMQVIAWLDRMHDRRDADASTDPGSFRTTARQAQRLVVLMLLLLGLVCGWAAAAAVFHYTGRQPVNVVGVLAVFVGLQLCLLILTALAALPDAMLRKIPGAEPVIDALRLLSPGRLAPLITRLLPQSHRDAFATALGRSEANRQLYGTVHKWAILSWSQVFAVAFNVGALIRYLYLVFFSDLAFAWSTTVQTDASTFHGIVAMLAQPWAWALGDAAPTYELVRDTRYFRLDDGAFTGAVADAGMPVDPATFGGWWPFLLMCLLVYGLLPRVITLLISTWRLRKATAAAVLHTPGVPQLLDRLNHHHVQTQATEPAADRLPEPAAAGDEETITDDAPRHHESVRAVVNWADTPIPEDALTAMVGDSGAAIYHVGGTRSLDEDQQTIRQIASDGATAATGRAIVIAVKSWEPPVLEIIDFLSDLRDAVGRGVPITVVPIAAEGRDVDPAHLSQWRRRLKTAGDPWLSVEAWTQREVTS